MVLRSTITVLALFIFTSISLSGCSDEKTKADNIKSPLPKDIDMALSGGVNMVEMDGDHKVWTVDSSAAIYSTESELIDLKDTRAKYYQDDKAVYMAAGENGRYDSKNRILDLVGKVKVESLSGYVLSTDSLRYSFADKIASTPAPVEIVGEGLKITGIGMVASVEADTIEIQQDVKFWAAPQAMERPDD